VEAAFQPSLLDAAAPPAFDARFRTLQRVQLDATAWIDHAPGWLTGSDEVFETLVRLGTWREHTRRMYDKVVLQPRLNASWIDDRRILTALPVLDEMRVALGSRYGVEFTSGGLNWYRDGRDSVAWHGDKIAKEVVDPIVAIVSVGEPRRFLARPKGGGRSTAFHLGRGDLIVTGGTFQRTWQHSVPKVAQAGPRISITMRHT